jgi:hypothetical protein
VPFLICNSQPPSPSRTRQLEVERFCRDRLPMTLVTHTPDESQREDMHRTFLLFNAACNELTAERNAVAATSHRKHHHHSKKHAHPAATSYEGMAAVIQRACDAAGPSITSIDNLKSNGFTVKLSYPAADKVVYTKISWTSDDGLSGPVSYFEGAPADGVALKNLPSNSKITVRAAVLTCMGSSRYSAPATAVTPTGSLDGVAFDPDAGKLTWTSTAQDYVVQIGLGGPPGNPKLVATVSSNSSSWNISPRTHCASWPTPTMRWCSQEIARASSSPGRPESHPR